MTQTSEERREVAQRLRLYAGIDFSESDPWWYMQKAMYLPKDAGLGKAIPFREAREALRDLADLIDPTCDFEESADNDEFAVRVVSGYICHNCGHETIVERTAGGWTEPPRYCSNCGARMVSDDDR